VKRYLVFWMLAIGAASASLSAIEFEFAGLRTYTLFGFLPAPAGADFQLRFADESPTSGASAAITLGAGGAYQHERIYRQGNGDLYEGDDIANDISTEEDITIEDVVGIDLLEFNLEPTFELETGTPLSLYFGTKSYFRSYIDEDPASRFASGVSSFPDVEGSFVNTIRFGAQFADIAETGSRGFRGFDASAAVEYGPEFFGNRVYGGANFLRLHGTARLYHPIFDLTPASTLNLLNISVAGQIVADWLTGTSVPIHEQSRSRGIYQYGSLGHLVRGFEVFSYPSLLKLAVNAELRILGPAVEFPWLEPILSHPLIQQIVELRWVAPIVTLFVDAGYYAGFRTGGYFATSLDGQSGTLVSTGASLSLQLFGVLYAGYMIGFPLVGERSDDGPGHGLALGFHF